MEEKFLQEEEPGAEKSSQFPANRDLNKPFANKSFTDFDVARLIGNKFGADEKLKSRKTIDKLFERGKSVTQNGFTLVYLVTSLSTFYPAQAGFSVPKKFFKHAVDRNRVKRLMREAYRLNKAVFYQKLQSSERQIALMFVFKGRQLPSQQIVTKALLACLDKIKL
jgi:ribonuclease P protein component